MTCSKRSTKTNNKITNLLDPNAIEILKENQDKIEWCCLCINSNPTILEILNKNLDKINWYSLSTNPNATEILENNLAKIDENSIFRNPAIFTYDYEKIKENKKELNEEIIIKALHPKRMLKLMETFGEDEIYKCYFDDD